MSRKIKFLDNAFSVNERKLRKSLGTGLRELLEREIVISNALFNSPEPTVKVGDKVNLVISSYGCELSATAIIKKIEETTAIADEKIVTISANAIDVPKKRKRKKR